MHRRLVVPAGFLLATLSTTSVHAATPGETNEPGPWIAFGVLVGGIAIALLVIAATGRGIGPEPRLERSAVDTGDHSEDTPHHPDGDEHDRSDPEEAESSAEGREPSES